MGNEATLFSEELEQINTVLNLNLVLLVVVIALLSANIAVTAWIGFKAWYAVMKAVELIGVAKEVLETAQEYSRVTKDSVKETERVVKETAANAGTGVHG